jgi:hypothetical protein
MVTLSYRHTGRINVVKLGMAKNDHVTVTYRSSTYMDALMPRKTGCLREA